MSKGTHDGESQIVNGESNLEQTPRSTPLMMLTGQLGTKREVILCARRLSPRLKRTTGFY